MKHLKLVAAVFVISFLMSCGGEKTDVVESRVYQGTIHEVEADKSEN